MGREEYIPIQLHRENVVRETILAMGPPKQKNNSCWLTSKVNSFHLIGIDRKSTGSQGQLLCWIYRSQADGSLEFSPDCLRLVVI